MPSRRTFLVAGSAMAAGFQFGKPGLVTANTPAKGGKAKSVILFFLSGGASHIDTWDMKPNAPEEYRGPFKPIATTAPGIQLCEHLPMTAKVAHHLALVRSVKGTVNTNDHHAGYYHNLTGHVPDQSFLSLGNNRTPFADDWPFMGSVVAQRRKPHPYLPNAITLPQKPSKAPYTRPGQFAGRIGVEFDPLYLIGTRDKPLVFTTPALNLDASVSPARLKERGNLLAQFDEARKEFEGKEVWDRLRQRAFSLLTSAQTASAFNLTTEPEKIRQRYGVNPNGMSLLLARRMVEAGVPFITVFWLEDEKTENKCKSGGGWDTHGSNFSCLKENLLPEFDQAYSALIEDLALRGLLDSTLVMITSEMGRKPKIGDPRSGGVSGAGRDHWTHCLTDILAGGGIRGGMVYGASDKRGEYPDQKVVMPADVTKTVYHAMGINNLEAIDKEGKPYNLLAEGNPLPELF